MNTFWGCDTEAVDALAETMREHAELLLTVIERLRDVATTVAWSGPDALAHRQRTVAVTATGSDLCRMLRDRADLLREEAAQQELASQADPRLELLRAVGAELPWSSEEDGSGVTLPRLQRRPLIDEAGPWIGGPFQARDPFGGFPAPPPMPGGAGPWIGGPLQRPSGSHLPDREPLPEGEEFAIAQDRLDNAEQVRRYGFSLNKYTAVAQSAMDLHAAAGAGLDLAETALVDNGLEELVPAVSLARMPHATNSLLFGERSVMGQVTGELEHLWANLDQTGAEVTDALGRGDLAAAARAGERGAYRHHEGMLGLAMASPVWEIPAVGAEVTSHAADAVEALDPTAAQPLREFEQHSRELSEGFEDARDGLLDSENWYDARRRAVTLPWDPRA